MNDTIHVELAAVCDAEDLIPFLAGRGLTGTITNSNEHCDVEIRYAIEPEVRLRNDVEAALASWLEGRDRPLVPTSDAEHDYVLRPPAD